jgi:7,8-dihydroneopterin 2',3'-cyclic phosphate phosphodiesterase
MDQQERHYITNLFPHINKIQNEALREKVVLTWYKAWKRSNFKRIEDVHQFEPARSYLEWSNVDHTNRVCTACETIAAMLAEDMHISINMDQLLAGAVLHDVDKPVIFDARSGGLTETGRRFAHAVMGSMLALAEGLPEEVAHIIGAHSVKFSPTPPGSVEAILVRHADHIVAESFYLAQGLNMAKVLAEAMAKVS